jgi:predicted amidohydrolase
MSLALTSYNDLVGDMIKGNLRPDVYPTWVDFDGYRCYSVAEIHPVNAARYHLPPGTTALVVCYDDAVVAEVADLEMARQLILDASGRRVKLVLEEDGEARLWLAEPVGVYGEA